MFLSSIEDTNTNFRSVDVSATPIAGLEKRFFDYKSGSKHRGALAVQRFADEIYQAKAVYDACRALQQEGFEPNAIICHGRWGAGMLVREAFPSVPFILYSEYFSTAEQGEECLKPNEKIPEEMRLMYRFANATNLISLEAADWIITPTRFQKQSHPNLFYKKMSVIHDGVDTEFYQPSNGAPAALNFNGTTIPSDAEVITYVTREFESYRGFETFMQAVAIIQKERPDVRVVIAGGGTGNNYGGEAGEAYKNKVLAQNNLNLKNIYFVGVLNPQDYRKLLQRSTVHVYLTVPFVLSWSLMEAMASGCAIVASKTAPVQEMISHNKEALLADFYDAGEVAKQVLQMLESKTLREKLGRIARKKIITHYSIPVIAKKYQQVIEDWVQKTHAK